MRCRSDRTAHTELVAFMVPLLCCHTAIAHHSFAQFQMDKSLRIVGAVESFEWTNPHTWLVVLVDDGKGGQSEWRLEGASVNELARAGWTKRVAQQGERVSVEIHPLRSGQPGGAFVSMTKADGSVFSQITKEQQAAAAASAP